MTEQAQNPQQQFQIQRIFLKDLSFESPLGAEVFTKQQKPAMNQELSSSTRKVDDTHFEVTLKITITAKLDDKTVFLVEIQQAGLFYMAGIEEKDVHRILNTMCLQIIFPYARETVDSVLGKGTFPPVMLAPVNFDAMYAQAMQKSAEEAKH